MRGLSILPWWVRLWRRWFETETARKRRRAREHKEFCQRMAQPRQTLEYDT